MIGYSINLNSDVWIGGLGRMTPYIRSKVATTNGFQGCIGVGGLYIINCVYLVSYCSFLFTFCSYLYVCYILFLIALYVKSFVHTYFY